MLKYIYIYTVLQIYGLKFEIFIATGIWYFFDIWTIGTWWPSK